MARGWENARMETAYTEARHVLDAQREVPSDVDSKAMYTVRVVVVIVGVIVAAVSIGGTSIVPGPLLVGGLSFLVLSTGFGVLTYTGSNRFVGPNRRRIRRLVERKGEDPRGKRTCVSRWGIGSTTPTTTSG